MEAMCDEGYTMVGSAAIRCLADGHWTEIPSCRPSSKFASMEYFGR